MQFRQRERSQTSLQGVLVQVGTGVAMIGTLAVSVLVTVAVPVAVAVGGTVLEGVTV